MRLRRVYLFEISHVKRTAFRTKEDCANTGFNYRVEFNIEKI